MRFDSIVWEWPERRGLEHVRLWRFADGMKADGLIVVDAEEGVIRLRYSISLQSDWRLRRCGIFVPVGAIQNSMWLSLESNGSWAVNGKPRPDLDKCVAFDIMDTPLPKTPIVGNLNLEKDESKRIWVACIDDRRLLVSPVEQEWERLPSRQQGFQHYRCTSLANVSEFDLDEDFLVHYCPQRWRIRSAAPRQIIPHAP
jgi:uncharacterized protein